MLKLKLDTGRRELNYSENKGLLGLLGFNNPTTYSLTDKKLGLGTSSIMNGQYNPESGRNVLEELQLKQSRKKSKPKHMTLKNFNKYDAPSLPEGINIEDIKSYDALKQIESKDTTLTDKLGFAQHYQDSKISEVDMKIKNILGGLEENIQNHIKNSLGSIVQNGENETEFTPVDDTAYSNGTIEIKPNENYTILATNESNVQSDRYRHILIHYEGPSKDNPNVTETTTLKLYGIKKNEDPDDDSLSLSHMHGTVGLFSTKQYDENGKEILKVHGDMTANGIKELNYKEKDSFWKSRGSSLKIKRPENNQVGKEAVDQLGNNYLTNMLDAYKEISDQQTGVEVFSVDDKYQK